MEAFPVASGGSTAKISAGDGGLSGRYAQALYAVAEGRGALDETVVQMRELGRLIEESEPFRRLLGSPLIDIRQSQKAADGVLAAQGFGKIVRDFVGVVATNRRLGDLDRFVAGFATLVSARRGIVAAEVASAHPLTDLQRTQLRARLMEAGYAQVDIHESVDADLLGGLVVRIGARLYDASLKSRLQRLHHAMKGAA